MMTTQEIITRIQTGFSKIANDYGIDPLKLRLKISHTGVPMGGIVCHVMNEKAVLTQNNVFEHYNDDFNETTGYELKIATVFNLSMLEKLFQNKLIEFLNNAIKQLAAQHQIDLTRANARIYTTTADCYPVLHLFDKGKAKAPITVEQLVGSTTTAGVEDANTTTVPAEQNTFTPTPPHAVA